MSDFWNTFINNSQLNRPTVMDEYLSHGQKKANADMYDVTSKGKQEKVLQLPAYSGTRVAFVASLESMMGLRHPPADGAQGTVVMIRSASYGDITSLNDYVFVKWDHGNFSQIDRHHLTLAQNSLKRANDFVKVAFSTQAVDFTHFLRVGSDSEDLIHKATQDLWSCQQGEGGEMVISRLFNETGEPLKGV